MALPQNIVSSFSKITNYNLKDYLSRYTMFIDNMRDNILNYYAGNTQVPDEDSFDELRYLINQTQQVRQAIDNHNNQFKNAMFWELVDVLTEIDTSLQTTDNSSKWLRSAISKNNFSPQVEVDYMLKQLQTLEDVAVQTGYSDQQNDWVTIALRNDLKEEQYTPQGGNNLLVGYSNFNTIVINSIVDNILGEKVYGIDIDRKITFVNNDIKTLSYKQSIKQAVDILANLRQGQTPEFIEDGIQSSNVVGSNRSNISYPILYRQIYATFKKDDRLKALTVTNIENKQDRLMIEFTVQTRLGEQIIQQTQL